MSEETSFPLLLSALIGMPHHYIHVGDEATGRCWADTLSTITLKEYKKAGAIIAGFGPPGKFAGTECVAVE